MSILKRLTEDELKKYTHEGWLLLCPIYAVDVHLDGDGNKGPLLTEKNWVPEFWLPFNASLQQALHQVWEFFAPDSAPNAFQLMLSERDL